MYKQNFLPKDHINFLIKLRDEYNFNPSVCYDIGSNVLHWTRHAHKVWPNSKIILFDAFDRLKIFYEKYDYHLGVLSNNDNKEVSFYQHDILFGGNSYYKENGDIFNGFVYDDSDIVLKKTNKLDTVVTEKQFPYPELIKIDVQGAELDILQGADNVLSFCKYLIIELQHIQFNMGAPLAHITIDYLKNKGWECIAHKFSNNGPDADYCFINTNLVENNSNSKSFWNSFY
jgi:FkbM family methyltransferase